MIKRHVTLICSLVFAVLALALHLVKFQVQALHERNSSMQHVLQQERESIRLLEAEWMVLNHPKRLADLAAETHQHLKPVSPAQLESWQGLAAHQPVATEASW
jgi:hypothetical protein